jgi:hypothetical protein
MNKQQITNHIASRLNSLIDENGNHDIIVELSHILQHITRDDDYSFSQNPTSIYAGSTTGSYASNAVLGGPSLSNSLVGEIEISDRPSRSGDSRR